MIEYRILEKKYSKMGDEFSEFHPQSRENYEGIINSVMNNEIGVSDHDFKEMVKGDPWEAILDKNKIPIVYKDIKKAKLTIFWKKQKTTKPELLEEIIHPITDETKLR